MDVFDKAKRSWIMSHVKGKDTRPEVIVRSIVHRLGFRFRKGNTKLPGNPDIVLPRHRKVIFVHGCFWHGHPGCKRAQRPTSNVAFWRTKLDRNIERDNRNIRQLKKEGWKVLVIWQCRMKDQERLVSRIARFLHEGEPTDGQ